MRKYLISKINLDDEVFTLHSSIKKLVQGQDFIIEQEEKYARYGRMYRGEKALRDRIRFGLTIGESYVVDKRLTKEQQEYISRIITEEEKELEERAKW